MCKTVFLKFLSLSFVLTLCFGAPLFMKYFTKGFHPARFLLEVPAHVDRNIPLDVLDKKELLPILSQPFFYLNRGAQCFVFESQDRKYVMKIFHESRPSPLFSKWKKQIKIQRNSAKPQRAKRTGFEGCLIAYRAAREETGLLYLHPYPTENELPKARVSDPIGRVYHLPLDRYFFLIQKKADSFKETLFKASLEGDLTLYFHSYFSLLTSRIGKGIWNEDTSLSSNFGFLGSQAIEIDFGRYIQRDCFLDQKFQEMEMKRFTNKLRTFVSLHLPDELARFDRDLAQFQENRR